MLLFSKLSHEPLDKLERLSEINKWTYICLRLFCTLSQVEQSVHNHVIVKRSLRTPFINYETHGAELLGNPSFCNTHPTLSCCLWNTGPRVSARLPVLTAPAKGFFLPESPLCPFICCLAINLSQRERHTFWQAPSCTMSVLLPFRSFCPFDYLHTFVLKSRTDGFIFWLPLPAAPQSCPCCLDA